VKNILVLNHTGWLGGAEICLLGYLERTRIPREKITCVLGRGGPLSGELAERGFATLSLSIPIPGLAHGFVEKISRYAGLVGAVSRIAGLVRERDIGLVYANSYRAALLLVPLTGIAPRVRIVTHVRDRIEGRLKRKLVMRASDRLIAISRFVEEGLGDAAGKRRNLAVIPTGVDTEAFRENGNVLAVRRELGIGADSFVFGMFCQVLPWKGVREFAEAAISLARERGDVSFLMTGDATFSGQERYFEDIKRRVRESGFEGRILFTGFRRDVARILSCVDAVVSASINEPLGQTLLQAMAVGKPVIATRSGGPLEIVVHGETGLLVEPGAVQDLARAMALLCTNRDDARRMGAKGRERFRERFLDMDEMARRIDDVLLGCLGKC
jgi:glycosyltransferase involved in cell wall biosynthesis